MLKSYVWSTLLYGSEAWTLSKTLKNRIEAFEMWCYRRMLKIKYTEHVPNDLVLIHASAQRNLLNICHERKLRYFGHIVRAEGIQAKICLGKINGKRARGRQKLQWSTEIFQLANTSSIYELVEFARDRARLRVMAANLQID